MKKEFDLLALGEVLLRLSPVNDDRLVRGDTFEKRVGGAELKKKVANALQEYKETDDDIW